MFSFSLAVIVLKIEVGVSFEIDDGVFPVKLL